MNYRERISEITGTVHKWLSDEQGSLAEAIDFAALEEGFERSDIFHRLQELERTITDEALTYWAEQAGLHLVDGKASDSRILCLHPGNLPLVGLQDIIAVLLSGCNYRGKISSREHHLTESLLNCLKQSALSERLSWSTKLEEVEVDGIDAVLFSGSEETVPKVWKKLHEIGCKCPPENRLIRTAAYSVAWMERCSDKDLHHLAEALMRYSGNGCRSVKLIASPLSLDEVKHRLELTFQQFNRVDIKEQDKNVRREIAFALATGKSTVQAGEKIIRSELDFKLNDNVIPWVQTGPDQLADFVNEKSLAVQNVYVEDRNMALKGVLNDRLDLLSKAQTPEIYWCPDGIDPLKWIVQQLY